ncbi:DUF3016 domain-containing protein [Dokdonella sp.]|uniref:DUF3016 domain-containing protein n=1 Tax=Dokdonella sp. TaxID=2291710 RepID=UPI003C5E08F8
MTLHSRVFAWFSTLVLMTLVSTHAPPAIAVEKPRVAVDWTDPAQFSEILNRSAFNQTNPVVWLGEFASTIRRHAPRVLKTGQSLSVTITDVTLAGTVQYGPGAVGVRVVGSNSPPRIKLRFTLTSADGQVIDNGDRNLSNPGFMSPHFPNNGDAYQYETRLLTDWMDQEFGRHQK